MAIKLIIRSLISLFFFPFISCYAQYSSLSSTLKQGQELKASHDPGYLASGNGVFKLGFFQPGITSIYGQSSNTYLGIWYAKLPNNPEAVWVANRDDPIVDSSGVFTLDFDGKLKITHSGGQPIVLNPNQQVSSNVTASLLDSGNFQLRELIANGLPGRVLWQSFDYPSNTLLPGMKLGVNLKSGQNWTLSSWLSGQVPSPGALRLGVDPGGINQLVVWQRGDVYWTSGVWRNWSFQNAPNLTRRADLFEFSFVSNEEEKYFSYSVKDNSTLSRWEVNVWGQILQFILDKNGSSWQNTTTSPCRPMKYPETVCIGQKTSNCRNGSAVFVMRRGQISSYKSAYIDENSKSSLMDCQASCWKNCSCIATTNIFPNGTGCIFFNNIADLIVNELSHDYAYFLTSKSNRGQEGTLTEQESTERDLIGSMRKRWWIWCAISSSLAATVILLSYFVYIMRRKLRLSQEAENRETSQNQALIRLRSQISASSMADTLTTRGQKRQENYELFSFSDITAATDNFSLDNKLGEGGFGPVYKGTLSDGHEIAVKRLASHSGQGLEEFMNEMTLIAELQHTNLVRLFGCCVQGEEKMLIYEYMPNKSLDSFLFDPIKRKLLDWKKRFDIIEGIAQGLLYLHKYSRLRIIHRDLKASNILLDEDMNPKISDFGMARIFGRNELTANTMRVVGTYGYMSPEYAMNGVFSVKSDVYSFGVLLLEIVSGKKNNVVSSSNTLNLIKPAWDTWKTGDIRELMDKSLGSSCPEDAILKCVHVGLLCVQDQATDRPAISDVIYMLSNEAMCLPDPKQAAYVSRISGIELSHSDGNFDASINSVTMTTMEAR